MRRIRANYNTVAATLALVFSIAALSIGGAVAGGVLVTSKQIKNGTIRSQDIHRNGVRSSDLAKNSVRASDIKNGAVRSADIGTGQVRSSDIGANQVGPEDVDLPEPEQMQDLDSAVAEVGTGFALVSRVGTYIKEDSASILEVDWTGTANAPAQSCVFQLRVDGQPSSAGAGVVFVQYGVTTSVSATALFPGLSAGAHTIEVWARITETPGANYKCIVGPAVAGIAQTFVVSEQVV